MPRISQFVLSSNDVCGPRQLRKQSRAPVKIGPLYIYNIWFALGQGYGLAGA